MWMASTALYFYAPNIDKQTAEAICSKQIGKVPLSRSQACIISCASIDPVNNLYKEEKQKYMLMFSKELQLKWLSRQVELVKLNGDKQGGLELLSFKRVINDPTVEGMHH